jgi:hypothetical protein
MNEFRQKVKMPPKYKFLIIFLVIGVSIALNFITFIQAYPETQKIDSGCCAPQGTLLAKDFSAFYFGAWNLIHDPSRIYEKGTNVSAAFLGILPHPELFKYLPSFLILMLPFLLQSYQNALLAFDIVQFVMLFLIAFILYRLLEGRNVALIGLVSMVALLLPFFTNPNWGLSEAYFWQWAEGQDKVLDLFLILLGLYFGFKKRTIFSGIFFGLSFFDPRFSILAIPLFVTLNKGAVGRASLVTISTFLVTNVSILAYPGVLMGFLNMLISSGATTPLYYYSYIPLVTIMALSITKWKEIARAFWPHRGVSTGKVEIDKSLL